MAAEKPIAVNIPARNGRHFGVRNFGFMETIAQPAPIVVI